jgi:spore maturation protein CgeB
MRIKSKVIAVFRTFPDSMNNNVGISTYATNALSRVLPDYTILSCGIDGIETIIREKNPVLLIGIGSILPDDISYSRIYTLAQKTGSKVCYWLHDDPYEFDFNWKLDCHSDWIFSNDKSSIAYYDHTRVSHLPLAADLDLHFAPLSKFEEKRTDFFFCGVAFANRLDIVSRLRHVLARYTTIVRGEHWDENLEFCANSRMSPGELLTAYAQSKIVLNIGRQHSVANRRYEIVPSTPGPRTFEAAARGCVQAAFWESCELFEYYKPGTDILTFSSVTDFEKIAEYYLQDPAKLAEIAANSQLKTKEFHTYDHRIVSMLSVLSDNDVFFVE